MNDGNIYNMNILINERDLYYMQRALIQAEKAFEQNEVPVGALVVVGDVVIAEAGNECERNVNSNLHAEIIAINRACSNLKRKYLEDVTLYVTLEPCMMCMGAIINSRIKRLVFGAYDDDRGACGSVIDVANILKRDNNIDILGGVMEDKCSLIISKFFKDIRKTKKRQ